MRRCDGTARGAHRMSGLLRKVSYRRSTGVTTASSTAAMRSPPSSQLRSSSATSGSGTAAGQRSRSLTASFWVITTWSARRAACASQATSSSPVVVMVLPGGHLHRRARRLGLGHERVGIGDARRGDHPLSGQRVGGTSGAAHQALERAQAEVGHRDRPAHPAFELAAPARCAASAVARFRVTITASARSSAAQPSRHGPGRQRPAHRAGGLGAHHQDVEVAADVEPLIGVVEHQHLRAVGQRALGARPPGRGRPRPPPRAPSAGAPASRRRRSPGAGCPAGGRAAT